MVISSFMLQRFLGLPALVLVWVLSLSLSFYFACCTTSVPVNLVGHDAPGFTFLITIMITLHGWANQSKPYMIDMTSNNILIMIYVQQILKCMTVTTWSQSYDIILCGEDD